MNRLRAAPEAIEPVPLRAMGRFEHECALVDPRTGIGLTDRRLITVIAEDCATADGVSTALSVQKRVMRPI